MMSIFTDNQLQSKWDIMKSYIKITSFSEANVEATVTTPAFHQ